MLLIYFASEVSVVVVVDVLTLNRSPSASDITSPITIAITIAKKTSLQFVLRLLGTIKAKYAGAVIAADIVEMFLLVCVLKAIILFVYVTDYTGSAVLYCCQRVVS